MTGDKNDMGFKVIQTRVDDEYYDAIKEKAEEAGYTQVSAYLRHLLRVEVGKVEKKQ
jgi:hypothetical protein